MKNLVRAPTASHAPNVNVWTPVFGSRFGPTTFNGTSAKIRIPCQINLPVSTASVFSMIKLTINGSDQYFSNYSNPAAIGGGYTYIYCIEIDVVAKNGIIYFGATAQMANGFVSITSTERYIGRGNTAGSIISTLEVSIMSLANGNSMSWKAATMEIY